MSNALRKEAPSNMPLILSSLLVLVCLVGMLISSYMDSKKNPSTPTFDGSFSWIGWTDEDIWADMAENAGALGETGVLPLMKVDSTEELNKLLTKIDGVKALSTTVSYGGAPKLRDVVQAYDDAFFKESCLLMVYVTEPSGSIRHQVTGFSNDGGTCVVTIMPVIDSETHTADMAGWMITVPVTKYSLEKGNYTAFSALRMNPSKSE